MLNLVGFFALVGLTGYFLGLLVGCLFARGEFAVQVLPAVLIPIMIYGGLTVNLNELPSYSYWIQYVSPIRHGYSIIMEDLLGTDKMHDLAENAGIREMAGINGTMEANIYLLVGEGVSFVVLCLIVLYFKKRAL